MATACGSCRRAWRRVGKAEVNMEVEAEVVEENEEEEKEEEKKNNSDKRSWLVGSDRIIGAIRSEEPAASSLHRCLLRSLVALFAPVMLLARCADMC